MSDQLEPLTQTQKKVLAFFKKAILKGGAPPTYRELREHFGWRSSAAARDHLHALVTKGYLRREPGHAARNYRLATAPVSKDIAKVPLVRRFLRDDDVFAEANHDGEVTVLSNWLPTRGRCFAMRVADDGMPGAALLGGDVLVARSVRAGGHHALVIANIGGELVARALDHGFEEHRHVDTGDVGSATNADGHVVGAVVWVMRHVRA